MKKLSKKLLALLLVFAMLIPTGAIAVTTTAAGNYITELATSHVAYRGGNDLYYEDVATAISLLTNNGYSAVDYDLNQGVFGDFIYMGYRLGSNSNSAIRDIKIYKGSNPPSYINETVNGSTCTYYPVLDVEGYAYDLNANANSGSPIYAYYTKDAAAGGPITSIYFSTSSSGANVTYFNSTSAANLNYKSGLVNSDAIYMGYTYDANAQPSVPTGPQFPAGYNFKEDSYRFKNYGDTISKKYFTTLYGTDNGKLLYKNQKKQGGLCFGFSYTTASIYNGLPDCSRISTYDEGIFDYKFCDNIREIWNLSVDFLDFTTHTTNITSSAFVVGDQTITIEDYIKYAHIYQFSKNVENGSVWCDNANDILNLVKSYTDSNNIGVTIGMTRKDGKVGHRVLAVGYDGNDILVDDPNRKDDYNRIRVNDDGSWTFNGLSGWNSNTFDIRYNLDFYVPYQLLLSGRTTTVAEKWINDQFNVSEHYIEGMDVLNADCCLVAIDAESYTVENNNLSKIITEEIETNENDDCADLYWLSKDKTITVSDFTGENNLIEFSGNGKILSLETDADGSVTFDVENVEMSVLTTENEEYQLVIEESYQDEEYNDLGDIMIITGTANGDEVVASETEDGIQVTGLNDITVTYETPDGTAETKADVTDGSTVNITVNDDKNTVETDWQDKEETETDEECKHSDANHDGICDACSEDFTKGCSCNCHGNAFMQFLHKIVSFLRKLFGMTQYQYCNCGKAHW